MRGLIPLLLLAWPQWLLAAVDAGAGAGAGATVSTARAVPDPLGPGAVLQVVLGLVLVVGLILLLAWAVRRINLVPGQRAGLQVVAALPLGQRERAVLVQVGEQQLLLGVGAGQVTLLKAFDEPVLEPARAPDGAFARRLQQALGARADNKGQLRGRDGA